MKFLSAQTFQCDITVQGATTLGSTIYLTGLTNASTWDWIPVGSNTGNQLYYRTYSQIISDITAGIGLSGYVPTSRTLTINGTTYDLTANRSWTISTVDYTSRLQHQVKAGVAINKGQAVYVTSADGTNMIVGLASNAAEATSSKTMGLLDATVAINGFANVVTEGLLAGLDTSSAGAEGDPVWLGTGGNLIYGLANKPYAPAHLVFIGIVTRKNNSNGEIFVKVQNGFELNEIHDVDLKTTVPVNGHILGFDGTLWVNKTIAGWLGYTPANASGTTNYISKFTGSTTLGNSQIFDNGTNVGIGTLLPDSKLHIEGTTTGTGSGADAIVHIKQNGGWNGNEPWALYVEGYSYLNGFRINAADGQRGLHTTSAQLGFSVEGDSPISFTQSVSVYRMYIAPGGNIGIGTTTPGRKLDINTDGGLGNANNYLRLSASAAGAYSFNSYIEGYYNDYGNGEVARIGLIHFEGTRPGSNNVGGNIKFYTKTLGGLNSADPTVKMTITADGNVGIGTTAPTYKLDVVGTFRASGQSDFLGNTGSGHVMARFNDNGTLMRFNTFAIENATGNAGQQANLAVGSTYSALARLFVKGSGSTSATTSLLVQNSSASPSLTITDDKASTFNGNVTIGSSSETDANSRSLVINGGYGNTSSDKVLLYLTAINNVAYGVGSKQWIYFGNGGVATSAKIGGINLGNNNYESGLVFNTTSGGSDYEVMRITNSQNVGIGTNAPAYKLDVNGNTRVTGTSLVYSNLATETIDLEVYRDFSSVSATRAATFRITTRNTTGNHGYQQIDFRHEGINSSPSAITTARISNYSADGGSGSSIFTISTRDTSPYAGSLRNKIVIDQSGNIQLTDSTDAYVYLGNTYAYGPRTGKVITVAQQPNTGYTGDHLILRGGSPNNFADRTGGDVILQGGYSTGTQGSNIYFQVPVPAGSSSSTLNTTYQTVMYLSSGTNVGIGTTSPSAKLHLVSNNASLSPFYSVSGNGYVFQQDQYGVQLSGVYGGYYVNGTGSIGARAVLGSGGPQGYLDLKENGTTYVSLSGTSTGNAGYSYFLSQLGVGTATSLGAKLSIKGSGSTSATTSLLVQNSAGTTIFTVKDDGYIRPYYGINFGSDSPSTGNGGLIYPAGNGMILQAYGASAGNDRYGRVYIGNVTATSNFLGYFVGTTIGTNSTVFGATSDGTNTTTYFYFGNNLSNIVVSAIVNIDSTTKGFLQPRMTNTQVNAISTPATGLQVYDTTNNKNMLYNGSSWQSIATESYVTTQITNLINGAPAALDTLNELATALGNDANFATTVTNSLASKVANTRTLTINGTSYDLSADRSWTIPNDLQTAVNGSKVTTPVNVGATVVASFSVSSYDGATFNYVLKDGTNFRAGTVVAVWNGATVQYNETTTNDIGNTTTVVLSVAITAGNAQLIATSSTPGWTMKVVPIGI